MPDLASRVSPPGGLVLPQPGVSVAPLVQVVCIQARRWYRRVRAGTRARAACPPVSRTLMHAGTLAGKSRRAGMARRCTIPSCSDPR